MTAKRRIGKATKDPAKPTKDCTKKPQKIAIARMTKTYNSTVFSFFKTSANLSFSTFSVKWNQWLKGAFTIIKSIFELKTSFLMVDDLDRKIIDILKLNSRQSYAEIGKQVFLSPSSVRERIKKLEDTGVIKGYSLRVNQTLLGNSLEVFIMLKMFSGKLKPALVEIETYPEVKEAYRITGQHNLFIRVALKDQLHLQQFIDKLVNFGEPTTHLILSRVGKKMT